MRSTLISLLALAVLCLCARSSPLPLASSYSSGYTIPRASGRAPLSSTLTSLVKRRPGGAEALESSAENVVSATKNKDWKRPVVITISGIGLAMTVGWNYIAAKSFVSNRKKYYKEKARLEQAAKKPPPKVGDTVCLVETYSTNDQVDARKPSQVKAPCFALGGQPPQQAEMASPGVDAQTTAPASSSAGFSGASVDGDGSARRVANNDGGVVGGQTWTGQQQPQPPIDPREVAAAYRSHQPTPASQSAATTTPAAAADSYDNNAAAAAAAAAAAGGNMATGEPLHKRGAPSEPGIKAIEEMVEEITPRTHSPPSVGSSSSSAASTDSRFPSFPSEREHIPLLRLEPKSGARPRPRPGFALARAEPSIAFEDMHTTPLATHDALEQDEIKLHAKNNLAARWLALAKNTRQAGGKLSTEDITFGLTVLNTVGNIPSLILTLINAYSYAGNPKLQ